MKDLMIGMLFPLATLNMDTPPRKASDVLNDVMPGLITLAVVAVWLGLIALARPVPDALGAILQVVIGFYFGQHVAMAAARGLIASAGASADAAVAASAATSAATVAATKASTDAIAAATLAGGKP